MELYLKFVLGLLLAMAELVVVAQETELETRVEANLVPVLVLNIDPDAKIEFGIEKISDNLYQITKKPDDVNFSVESTGNWTLSISAINPYFTGVNDSTSKIPVDFIGYYVENRGTNWDNGIFSHIANRSKDTILPLKAEKSLVLISGKRNNIGGHKKNMFVLRWKFIYEDELTKMKKFTQFNIIDDHYVDGFYITLSEDKKHYK